VHKASKVKAFTSIRFLSSSGILSTIITSSQEYFTTCERRKETISIGSEKDEREQHNKSKEVFIDENSV
jgi:hypothetical protein